MVQAAGAHRLRETYQRVGALAHRAWEVAERRWPPGFETPSETRTAFLHLDGSTSQVPSDGAHILPADAATLAPVAGSFPCGRIVRAAWHWDLGPIALAILDDDVPAGTTLLVEAQDGFVSALEARP